jgi:diaminopimelate epimerase
MRFTKMHGLGNDYVVMGFREAPDIDFHTLAEQLCNRWFGVGADGLIAVLPSDSADFRMRIFNSDGSEAEMCGNGTRCATKYFLENVMPANRRPADGKNIDLKVETAAGARAVVAEWRQGRTGLMTVDMGEPILDPEKIPVKAASQPVVDLKVDARGRTFLATCVSMGNPHAVIFFDEDVDGADVCGIGPAIETHPLFPRKTNVEFINVISRSELKMRVWERGVGETLACGTGTCASVVAAGLTGRTGRDAVVHLRGGDLKISWADSNHVFMTGPAETVFTGEIPD